VSRALRKIGRDVVPWPPCAVPLFIEYRKDKKREDETARMRTAILAIAGILQGRWFQQTDVEDGWEDGMEGGAPEAPGGKLSSKYYFSSIVFYVAKSAAEV